MWSVSLRLFGLVAVVAALSGCFRLGRGMGYEAPPPRPEALERYYKADGGYSSFVSTIAEERSKYTHHHIIVQTGSGPIILDYFASKKVAPDMVFVFPVLGGKNVIEKHIAEYMAQHGVDAAIVNRSNEFKDPTKFDDLEEIFRKNVIRDRLAIDFFEREYGKKNFGTIGISRGGINVAVTAGVDPRLKYNVIALGGTDMVNLFHDSNQKRIQKYINSVRDNKKITEKEFYSELKENVRTDPKYTAHFMDAKNSLLILAIFDKTVPFSYGLKLREDMGYPKTVFLMADHFTGLLFTQTVSLVPPRLGPGLFPFPYIEQEALTFFRSKFKRGYNWGMLPYRIFQFPVNVVAEVANGIGSGIGWLFRSHATPVIGDNGEKFWAAAIEAGDLKRASPVISTFLPMKP